MGELSIEIRVASDERLTRLVGTRTEQAGTDGLTRLRLRTSLAPRTTYFWNARAVANTQAAGAIASAWSAPAQFATGAALWPPPPAGGHPPNMLHVVQRVAHEHPEKLEAAWDGVNRRWIEGNKEFLDLVIEALRSIDRRWAYNCVRGECNRISIDAAAYYRGDGTEQNAQNSTDVAIIDFLAGQPDGSTPRPAWNDATEKTRRNNTVGRWKYPRPGR